MLFPLPDFFEEFFAAEIVARQSLRIQLTLDNDLRRDAGMVGARLSQGIGAAHAMVAGQRIHDGLVETMAHVQRTGHIRWRQQDAEIIGFSGIETGGKVAFVLPEGVPTGFYVLGFK